METCGVYMWCLKQCMKQCMERARSGVAQGMVVLVGDHRGFSSEDIAGYEKDRNGPQLRSP